MEENSSVVNFPQYDKQGNHEKLATVWAPLKNLCDMLNLTPYQGGPGAVLFSFPIPGGGFLRYEMAPFVTGMTGLYRDLQQQLEGVQHDLIKHMAALELAAAEVNKLRSDVASLQYRLDNV